MEFAIGGGAAVCAGFFTNPLEVLKTRMQLQGELKARGAHAVHYKNVIHAGYQVAKNDGVLALQKGLVPALWVQLFLNGNRLVFKCEVKMSSAEEIKTEYMSSLADLKFNSKPLINVLTMLAEENSPNAKVIVEAIETHLAKVSADVKLPVLYLIDCIMKNVGGTYTSLFSKNIVSTFCGVFGVVDEKTRAEMFKLRQTWNDVFPQMKLYAIDVQIAHLDPAWPVTAKAPPNSIHFNPKFLKTKSPVPAMMTPTPPTGALDKQTLLMQEELIQKQKELLELKQRKLELEVLQTKVKLQEQIKNNPPIPQNILLKPEVAKQLVPNLKPKTATTMPIAQQAKTSVVIPNSNSSRSQTANTATKPIRDPRLLRQQQQNQQQQQQKPGDNQLGQKTANLDNNKIVTNNKTNGRKARRDPRLLINKDDKTPVSKPDSTAKPNQTKSNNPDSKHPKPKSSSSSTDAPSKTKRSSPMRHKKRHKGDKSDEPTTFKGSKGAAKGRNYVRRNLSSPDEAPASPKAVATHDEDLRGFAAPPMKQARLQEAPAPPTGLESKNGTLEGSVKDKDVDLRHLPAIITRKRLSADSPDTGSAKKSKSEMLDRLFGAKDTDLRQLPGEDPVETKSPRSDFSKPTIVVEDRPPTPPPPIISNSSSKRDSTKNDLDIVRAKLANATNKMSKSIPKKSMEHRDLRLLTDSAATHKVIISKEDEFKIRSGDMTKEQEADLLKKIIMQIETNKLNEAKQIEKSISDDDLSDEGDKKQPKSTTTQQETGTLPFKDKDERLNVKGAPQPRPDFFSTFGAFRRFQGPQAWRGGRGGPRWPAWDAALRPRGWAPPPPPPGGWRNALAGYAHHEEETAVSTGSLDASTESPPPLPNGHVNENEIKTIAIDGSQKDIRFYDETAVVFLNWDDPREISFLDPKGRRVVFDDDVECFLEFGEPYKEIVINGSVHRVRLGAPSREIYIDRVPYECYFGSPGIRIELNGVAVTVKLDGPPPQVKIGDEKRCDLVAGKVTLFVDAKVMMPIFLDAKQQQFEVNRKMCTLKFVNALKTVVINDKAFDVEYGGLPKPVMIYGKRRFIRFSVLPRGIRPGRVRIKDMEGDCLSPMHQDENSQDGSPSYFDTTEPALPAIGRTKRRNVTDSPDRNSNSPNAYQNLLEQQSLNNLDLLTPTLGPVSAAGGYQLDNSPHGEEQKGANLPISAPSVPNALNINDLFQKLVSSGFITTGPKEDRTEKIKTVVEEEQSKVRRNVVSKLKLITFARPETLKVRQAALYSHLYSGMQCSSCGMRFSPEASMLYSQHLDWHFRQNRKGKRNSRVAASRRWFYSLSDWKNYEELEDMEEREKNYFDQQQQSEGGNDADDEDVELPSVPADPDSTDECCEMCRDKFDQFFNEEKEEWHLENAIRVEEKTYHPVCYEDYQKSLLVTQQDDSKLDPPPIEEEKKEEQIPGLEIIIDDDDDEEFKATDDGDEPYEPGDIVSLGSDESKQNEQDEKQPEEEGEGEEMKKKEDEDDDDVILNEVAPIKIVVDDDEDGEEGKDKTEGEEEEKVFQIKDEKPDDGFMEVTGLVSLPNGGQIKIKAEPIDPDDLPPETPSEPRPPAEAEPEDSYPAHTELVPSIDGNIDLVTSAPTTGVTTVVSANKIKINISKPLPVIHNKEKESAPDAGFPSETYIDPSEPFPPGEEPEQLRPSRLKPALEGVELRRLPPVRRGSELTGLCSIM